MALQLTCPPRILWDFIKSKNLAKAETLASLLVQKYFPRWLCHLLVLHAALRRVGPHEVEEPGQLASLLVNKYYARRLCHLLVLHVALHLVGLHEVEESG